MSNPLHKPLISSFTSGWLGQVTIKDGREPFQTLPPAATHQGKAPAYTVFDDILQEQDIPAYLAKDNHPLPTPEDREAYHGGRDFDWWLSGLRDMRSVLHHIRKDGGALSSNAKVLEFGCASGRVLRHFACQQEDYEIWGCDLKLRHVEWVRQFLPPRVRIFHNTLMPTLPIEDNYLDVVCAFSVFTHIDDMELTWLAELRRVLKPGGYAYISVHTEDTWHAMKDDWPLHQALLHESPHIVDYAVDREFLAGPMPSDKTVFWWPHSNVYNCAVFHRKSYIQSAWGRFFGVRGFLPRAHIYQDVVLLQKLR